MARKQPKKARAKVRRKIAKRKKTPVRRPVKRARAKTPQPKKRRKTPQPKKRKKAVKKAAPKSRKKVTKKARKKLPAPKLPAPKLPAPTRPSFPGPRGKTPGWADAAQQNKARAPKPPKAPKAPTPNQAFQALLKQAGAHGLVRKPRRSVEHFEGRFSSGWKVRLPIWDFYNRETEKKIRTEALAWKPRRAGKFWLVNIFCTTFTDANEVRSYTTVGMSAPLLDKETEKFRTFFSAQVVFPSGKRTAKKTALAGALQLLRADHQANGFAMTFVQFVEVHSYRDKTTEETAEYMSRQRRKATQHGKRKAKQSRTGS